MERIKFILIFIHLLIFAISSHAASRYRVETGTGQNITEHGVCRRVTNSSGFPLMVPTHTSTGWASFYNSSHTNVTVGSCPCLNAGDLCTDGSIYIGGGMYTTPSDAPGTYNYFPGADYCGNLDAYGSNAWSIPSKAQLNTLYALKNTGALAGTLNTTWPAYWTNSPEIDGYWDGAVWGATMDTNSGTYFYVGEPSYLFRVRCVR